MFEKVEQVLDDLTDPKSGLKLTVSLSDATFLKLAGIGVGTIIFSELLKAVIRRFR